MLQYNSKNLSAVKLSALLDDMGVENNDFFLELHDEKLLNVDPWDDNLDDVTKARITREISCNIWYFLREVCRIPEAGSTPFEFHRGNLAIVWSILHDISFYVVIPRQTFKTYTIAAVYYWLVYWGTMKSTGFLFGNSEDLVKNNLERIKKIRDELPPWLRLHEGKDNQHELEYSVLENTIKIKAPGKSKDDAMKVGRGFSTAMQWYDEFAFIPHIQYQYESALYAYSTVAQVAKKNGLPHHKAISTTAASMTNPDARWAYRFLNNCADFSEKLYDMKIADVREYIHASSTNGVMRIEFMYYDLSKDEGYFDRMIKDSDGNWDAINREVLNMWLDASTDHPLGQDTIILLNGKIRTPVRTLVIDDVYLLKIYRNDIDWNKLYAAGIDCGGNVMRDFSTIVVTDPTNMEVVATLRSNSYSTSRFSDAIVTIMKHVFPALRILPERNAMGIAIIDNVIKADSTLKSRIYHDETNKPGIHNNSQIRTQIYNDILKVAVREDAEKIHDRNIIQEIGTLTVTRSGRIDHKRDEHDDTLMAYLLARWFLTYAKNRGRYVPLDMIQSDTSDSKIDNQENNYMNGVNSTHWAKGIMNGETVIDIFNPQQNAQAVKDDNEIFNEIGERYSTHAASSLEELDGDIDEKQLNEKDLDDVQKELKEKKKTVLITHQNNNPNIDRGDIYKWINDQLKRL